jgi:small subunit ribosomal protein S1
VIFLRLVTEGYNGQIVTSDNSWPKIYAAFQSKTILQVEAKGVRNYTVDGREIPCIQVHYENITGIIPANESGLNGFPQDPTEIANLSAIEKRQIMRSLENKIVGLPIWILILVIDKENSSFLASRKRALEIMSSHTWNRLKEGEVIPGTVREVYPKSVVVDIGGIETRVGASEIAWGWVEDARNILERGKTYNVKVMSVDHEQEKVGVSLKQAQPSPWPDCGRRYVAGGIYSGTVSGIIDKGIFVNLEPGVDIFVHHPKFTRVKKGDKIRVFIRRVDAENQRIYGNIRG